MFVRNLQGDVLSLINAANGETLIEYNYDAWGNMEYTVVGEGLQDNEETAMILTALCPLTYRGYNYDFTTGLYYLQSRYYNPEWGRFLNMDDTSILLSTTDKVLGSNLYAYCDNNPVNRVDYTGQKSSGTTVGENIAIKGCLALAIYCDNDKSKIEKFRKWDVYAVSYFYPLNSSLLQFIFVFKDSWGYYTINALVGTKDEWATFIDKRSYRISDYLSHMTNAHNNSMLHGGMKTGMEGVGVITLFYTASYIVGPTYIYLDDKSYFDHFADMNDRNNTMMIAATNESWDTKSSADRKLQKKKVLSGTDYKYWYRE